MNNSGLFGVFQVLPMSDLRAIISIGSHSNDERDERKWTVKLSEPLIYLILGLR